MSLEKKMAQLICEYSLDLKEGDIFLIRSETVAEPLVKEFVRKTLEMGAHPVLRMMISEQQSVFYKYATEKQLEFIPPSVMADAENITAQVYIDSTDNTKQLTNTDKSKVSLYAKSMRKVRDVLMDREEKGEFRWSLCPYPTQAMAQDAEMSLDEYTEFVFNACKLNEADPVAAWKEVDEFQNKVVDILTGTKEIRIEGKNTDITFNVEGRKWINCNGHHNMPDGEVFTSPVEDGVNGQIYFDLPTSYMGVEAGGITLKIDKGRIIEASAEKGDDFLQSVLDTDEGSRLIGEIAFGLNDNINKPTKNILFDEKIGRTIHMAVGASYPEAGGKNKSGIHWDMIKGMADGKVYADGVMIYSEGRFHGV
ncbi:peptidase M29 aminopeptidase II [Denitrovibrio acetiphilus DSM 12809]|uniref:Peptidase M29 aminopeptidase II n=1 Tax=Denitrovibrio acetiphilus (strain DSM 12809 / NBRC 114555 / N2460) TaxID=522772 RepID=D4H5B3_DENA2|nr:aminopeptidase [Denitrovibrio acetiphilus]ADD67533.1 peptidase M29 aminopeptidase II [Denitrovibrio acetiphilus DSM 12809]